MIQHEELEDTAQDAMVLQNEHQGQGARPIVITDQELNFKIRMLKRKEMYLMNLSSILQSAIDPLYII